MTAHLIGDERNCPVLEVLRRAIATVVNHAAVHKGLDRGKALDPGGANKGMLRN